MGVVFWVFGSIAWAGYVLFEALHNNWSFWYGFSIYLIPTMIVALCMCLYHVFGKDE